jgi:polysaccharide export outer membrane protein
MKFKLFKLKAVMRSAFLSILLALQANTGVAQDTRFGVLLPGETQLQQAVKAAARVTDEPLPEPEVEVTLPVEPQVMAAEEPSELEKKVAETLETISLEEKIQKQVVQAELEQFGYDIFSQAPTTFAPVEGIPVPPDYVIGPGDTFILQIYGPTDVEYRLVVTREGKLLIPEVGDIQVAGLTFEEAKLTLGKQISKLRIGVRTVVTLADLHTIHVMMVGEVSRPGAYTVSGLSSLLNTLITTGGIKRTGTLRNVQVRRQNKIVATMDIYQVLLKGLDESNIYLRQGDVIFVPPIGRTIGVAGEVHRPAIYELKDETTVDEVLALAGGLLPTAAADKSHIERITKSGLRTLVAADLDADGGNLTVKNGDLIRVFPVLNKMEDVVLLSGHVLVPGGFQWQPGMRVSDLIRSSSILRQSAEYEVALVQREVAATKRLEAHYFNLGKVLTNPASRENLTLSPRDQVMVFDTHSPRGAQVDDMVRKLKTQATAFEPPRIFNLKGYLRHSGEYPLEKGMRLLDAINVSGGVQVGTDTSYSLLVRKDQVTKKIEFIQLSLDEARKNPRGDHNPVIHPEDRIYVFDFDIDRAELIKPDIELVKKQTGYGDLSPIVRVAGKVVKPGTYPLVPGMRVKDLVIAAGGMKEDAFGLTASLSRHELLNGEFTKTDNLNVKLQENSANDFNARSILHPYDHLVLREKPEWNTQPKLVKIEGEVIYPGEYQVGKRETLCSLVQRAGGFTEDAYLFGTVFLRESVREREQEAMNRLFDQLDDLLVDVHISPGYGKDEKLPVNKNAHDIHRVINQLDRPKAVGRMVIDVETAVKNCDETADIVLEDGDRLIVPKYKEEVSVVGQVYHPTSHKYQDDRAAYDYVNLSGGTKEFAARDHTFIVQANGEVMTARSSGSGWGWLSSPVNVKVSPGSTIYVPLSVDRINDRESVQSWVELVYKLAISAASLKFVFDDSSN